jgi:hypothetical protein
LKKIIVKKLKNIAEKIDTLSQHTRTIMRSK